jgi:two-component system response regulator ArlR
MKILIVEDDLGMIGFMKRGLEAEQYEVHTAADGEKGVDLVKKGGYGIIILDVYLPKKSGLEICKALREANVVTPILIMTARDSPEIIHEGFKAGANDYIPKPFPFDLLLAKIEVLDPSRNPSVYPEDM